MLIEFEKMSQVCVRSETIVLKIIMQMFGLVLNYVIQGSK